MDMVWGYGGIETYILNILDNIDRPDFTFDIALPGVYKHINEDALIDRGVNVIHYQAHSIWQQIKEIRKILKAGNYDIVHIMQNYVSLESPAVFSLVAIAEKKHYHYKIINHAHNTENTMKVVSPAKKVLRNAFRGLLRNGFGRADLLAGCSQEAGHFLYGHKANVDIFYNGIHIDKFLSARRSTEISDWRRKYNIDDNKLNFVIVARMADQKNPLFAIDIVNSLCRYYPNLCLTWAGDGVLRDDIINKVEQYGISDHVHFLGNKAHIEEILACCDYFLFPSKMEGAPLVLIEAQASALKCFASDRVPNVIDCGGVSFIGLDKTAEQWADEIHALIESEPTVSINMDLLSRFDINKTVAALSEVYDRLVETE